MIAGNLDIKISNQPEIFYEIEAVCLDLYYKFDKLIFHDLEQYHYELPMVPQWVYHVGLDSDFTSGTDIFNQLIQEENSTKYFKHLFLADCHSLIGSIQNRILATESQYKNFFKYLDETDTTYFDKDGYYWTTGENTIVVFSILHDLIITSYAVLDLIAKLAFQLENIPSSFDIYPKMKSKNFLYGKKNKIKKINFADTIFESNRTIKIIESFRHDLIHNGTWEAVPKVHYQIKDGEILEKFIFQPDITEDGTLKTVKNRKRFFTDNRKINETLPILYSDFWNRIAFTLNLIKSTDY